MSYWIKMEAYLFVTNIVGISIYLLVKAIVNKLDYTMRIEISKTDERCSLLTDALSRNVWDAFACQWAINSFMVSAYILFNTPFGESEQLKPLYLNFSAACIQVLQVVQLFGLNFVPI